MLNCQRALTRLRKKNKMNSKQKLIALDILQTIAGIFFLVLAGILSWSWLNYNSQLNGVAINYTIFPLVLALTLVMLATIGFFIIFKTSWASHIGNKISTSVTSNSQTGEVKQ